MAIGPSKRQSAACGVLLVINSIVTMAYLYISAPHLLFTDWLLTGSGIGSILGI